MKTLVVNDTVSVPVRTVKNHRMSPGKALAEADPALCGFTEGRRGTATLPHCHRSLFNASKQLAWNEQHTFASWTVTRLLLVTLMADSRLAAT